MNDLAQKLMAAAQFGLNAESLLVSNPIARRFLSRQKASFRIGLWPVISDLESDIGIAMGLGLTLAALLEQEPSISVYRLMTRVGDVPETYQWKIEDSQFGVDDWEVDDLDENVAIWGSLVSKNGQFALSLEIEDDARPDDETLSLTYEDKTIGDLVKYLPQMANSIIKWLNATSVELHSPYNVLQPSEESSLRNFLEDIFLWEVNYFLELWGQGTTAAQILQEQENLVGVAAELGSDYGAWMLSQTISRFVMFEGSNWCNWLIPELKATASALGKFPVSANILASTLFHNDEKLDAFDTLEHSLIVHPEDMNTWMMLGDLYVQSGEDLSAINVYQRAIEAGAVNAELYLRYAGLMDSLVEHRIELSDGTNRVSAAGRPFVEQYILVDSTDDNLSLRESCAAYQHVVELDKFNVDALAHLIVDLRTLDDKEAWPYVEQLINSDIEGAATAAVIEQLPDSDLEHMAAILNGVYSKKPKATTIQFNLVRVYLALGDHTSAKHILNSINPQELSSDLQPVLARLRVLIDYTDYEARIGDVQDVLDAKGQVTSEDVDFLESVIEKEPLLPEAYRLLARSYLSWYETDDALEVLLDGQKNAPFDAELVALLADVLWDADQQDLAFSYLEQGLKQSENNAALLSTMGLFLFENGDDNLAKEYLRRAEVSDPLNQRLSSVRAYIASAYSRDKKSDN